MEKDTSDDARYPTGLRPGDVVGGRYRIQKLIGTGRFGVVLTAVDTFLGRLVAIKSLVGTEWTQASRERVLYYSARFDHPYFVRVGDVLRLDEGHVCVVMEYLEGRDLARWLRESGPLPIELAVRFIFQACMALRSGYSCGLVHGDLRPSHLFCVSEADGHQRIALLGFWRPLGFAGVRNEFPFWPFDLEADATSLGRPDLYQYYAPEVFQYPRGVGHPAAEVWSLGAILYELLTGKPPFVGRNGYELIDNILYGTPPPIRDVRPEVPKSLEDVIINCLRRDPLERYQGFDELAEALAPFTRPSTLIAPSLEMRRGFTTLSRNLDRDTPVSTKRPRIEVIPQSVRPRRWPASRMLVTSVALYALVPATLVSAALALYMSGRRSPVRPGPNRATGPSSLDFPHSLASGLPPPSASSPEIHGKPPSHQEELEKLLKSAYQALHDGEIAFPELMNMRQGTEGEVRARIAPDRGKMRIEGIGGQVKVEPIKVSPFTVACLHAIPGEFTIRGRSGTPSEPSSCRDHECSCIRNTVVDATTDWVWGVTPLDWGTKDLSLQVSARLELSDNREEGADVLVVNRPVIVKVSPSYLAKKHYGVILASVPAVGSVIMGIRWMWTHRKGRPQYLEKTHTNRLQWLRDFWQKLRRSKTAEAAR
jgi:serine/threonine protein kinase